MDLAALVRRGATAKPARLRGLGSAWRAAESALLADVTARPRHALRLVARFERLARQCGEDEALGRAARLRGSALSLLGRFAASVAAYRVAARRLDGAARDGARVGLAPALTRLGRRNEALRVCRQVRRDAEARGDAVLAAAARMNEGDTLHASGDPATALPLYRAAGDAFAAAGQTRHAARCLESTANALVLLDRYDEALPLYESAAAELARSGLPREAAITRYNRGALLGAMDRLGEADAELESAERALRVAGDAPNAALARLYRGEALLRAHLVPEARRLIRTALRSMGTRVPPVERTRAMLLAARAEIAAGDAAAARRLLAKPLPLRTPAAAAERTEILGRAFAAEGRLGEARRRLERAAAAHGDERPAARAGALAAASWCATESGDAVAGRRLAATAERIAARLPVAGLRFAAAAARFSAEAGAKRTTVTTAAASAALARAFDALESLRAGLSADAFRAALLRGSERWFASAVRHVLDHDGDRAALALLERWRARSLVDLIGAGQRVGGAATTGTDAAAALRARLAVLERRLGGDGLPPFLRSLAAPTARRLAAEIGRAERALRDATARRVGTRTGSPQEPVDLDALAARLPSGTLVLSLFADDRGGIAFAVDNSGVRAVRGLGTEDEIASLAEELRFRIGKFALGPDYVARNRRRLAAETDALLAAIAERTLAPVADLVRRAQHLIVVPHGPWHRVPFAALPFDGGRLVDHASVSFAPALAAIGRDVPAARGPSLVVAVPDPQAPAISEEGRRVARTIPGARLVEGDAATASALELPAAPAVLHIAAHGRFRADAPEMSGVRLADGWLRACEWPRLRLDGSLVVLSGCDTGVARIEAGGEVLGLVRGVLAAGAREVVVSLWRVDDAATAAFMADFHATRESGAAPSAALQSVQKSFRKKDLHPWYWAGFCVVGP